MSLAVQLTAQLHNPVLCKHPSPGTNHFWTTQHILNEDATAAVKLGYLYQQLRHR